MLRSARTRKKKIPLPSPVPGARSQLSTWKLQLTCFASHPPPPRTHLHSYIRTHALLVSSNRSTALGSSTGTNRFVPPNPATAVARLHTERRSRKTPCLLSSSSSNRYRTATPQQTTRRALYLPHLTHHPRASPLLFGLTFSLCAFGGDLQAVDTQAGKINQSRPLRLQPSTCGVDTQEFRIPPGDPRRYRRRLPESAAGRCRCCWSMFSNKRRRSLDDLSLSPSSPTLARSQSLRSPHPKVRHHHHHHHHHHMHSHSPAMFISLPAPQLSRLPSMKRRSPLSPPAVTPPSVSITGYTALQAERDHRSRSSPPPTERARSLLAKVAVVSSVPSAPTSPRMCTSSSARSCLSSPNSSPSSTPPGEYGHFPFGYSTRRMSKGLPESPDGGSPHAFVSRRVRVCFAHAIDRNDVVLEANDFPLVGGYVSFPVFEEFGEDRSDDEDDASR